MKIYQVLIVDDSNVNRNQLGRFSGQMGFEVVATAGDADTAYQMYKLYKPDVVTMDLTMPGWETTNDGGLEAIRRLTEDFPEANILVVSGIADKATGIQALLAGARGFINKPFNEEELFSALKDMVESMEENH